MRSKNLIVALLGLLAFGNSTNAQTTDRPRPAEWNNLIYGGRFMDRFLPMTNNDLPARKDVWGAPGVIPRYAENGIENSKWSFWCASIKYEGGKYHMFTVGWLESSPRGHATWPNSILFHAISDKTSGPYIVQDTIGKGHNAEAFKLKDGRWIVYVINGYYIAPSVNGPWKYKKFDFQNRDRKIMDGMSNCTFAQREDGTYLMVNRGGGVWFSQTGESAYNQISETRAYPAIKGNFEDPVVWRDNVQYNLIVNDWLGRIAYYMRSKDGVNWKTESGEAYLPGISKHEDGTVEAWWKYERMRVFQDSYGRAVQANFAVIDVEKNLDKPNDIHSSKNIIIPLMPGRLITILDKSSVTASTQTVRIKIAAEKDFNPQTDIDFTSLNFGASEDVNYGRGFKVLKTERSGKDIIITFNVAGKAITDDDYAAKLLGKTKNGQLVFGYALLPWINKIDPIMSARLPVVTANGGGFDIKVHIDNYGQVASKGNNLLLTYTKDGQQIELGKAKIKAGVKPFEGTDIKFKNAGLFDKSVTYDFTVIIDCENKLPVLLHGKVIL
ncbi:MAG: glycoside hydrolase family protein [Mucilaginibacter sp.]|nr:glycoside hydrolase family protein [Mucilaginibacter sp.]